LINAKVRKDRNEDVLIDGRRVGKQEKQRTKKYKQKSIGSLQEVQKKEQTRWIMISGSKNDLVERRTCRKCSKQKTWKRDWNKGFKGGRVRGFTLPGKHKYREGVTKQRRWGT